MGQRLVIEIKRNEIPIAAVYYHWSAYTESSLSILFDMNQHVLSKADEMTNKELQLALIRFSENYCGYGYIEDEKQRMAMKEKLISEINQCIPKNDADSFQMASNIIVGLLTEHGGISPEDLEKAKKEFPNEKFSKDVNRNDGLVAISLKNIEKMLDWAEGIMIVNLDDKSVINGNIYAYDNPEYLDEIADMDDSDSIAPEDIEEVPINMGTFSLNEIPIVLDIVSATKEGFLQYKDEIYEIITG